MLVDSHCHLDMLDLSQFEGGLDTVLAAAENNQVQHMLCVSVNLDAFPKMLALVEPYPQISVSVGIHPDTRDQRELDIAEFMEFAQHPKVVAIGETGLDYFRSEGEDHSWQHEHFRQHIRVANQVSKPLIVHTRNAKQDTLNILQAENAALAGGVLHCFTEDWDMAAQAIAMNFYISFSGIVTFKSAKQLQAVAERIPLERMLVETDSPYLAPVPFRGKQNQPAYVKQVAEFIAKLRGVPLQEIADATTNNFYTLFAGVNRGCHTRNV